jgi:ketosteroid isomerase-like protein
MAVLLLLLGSRGPGLAAQATIGASTPEDSVRGLEFSWARALLHADTSALSRMIADEFVEISRGGALRTKTDNIRDIGNGNLRLALATRDSLAVRIYGEVAVVRGIADNTGSFRGAPFSGRFRYTRVFVRRDGRWQAVVLQQTALQ